MQGKNTRIQNFHHESLDIVLFGVRRDPQFHFELVGGQAAGTHIDRDLNLWLAALIGQALWRFRVLEGQILDVLGVDLDMRRTRRCAGFPGSGTYCVIGHVG